jgi:hypothetical protein
LATWCHYGKRPGIRSRSLMKTKNLTECWSN